MDPGSIQVEKIDVFLTILTGYFSSQDASYRVWASRSSMDEVSRWHNKSPEIILEGLQLLVIGRTRDLQIKLVNYYKTFNGLSFVLPLPPCKYPK